MEISKTIEEVLLQLRGAHHCPGTWLLYTYPNISTEWKSDSQHCAEKYWLCCLRKMYLTSRKGCMTIFTDLESDAKV